MRTKFKVDQKVLLKDKERTVIGTSKNFSTNKVSYRLDGGEMVNESQLSSASKVVRMPSQLEKLQDRYAELYGKPPANSKKNDAEWLSTKIQENAPEESPWEVLDALSDEAVHTFITEKELDIDAADYNSVQELKIAIAEELEIEIPE